jgi:hypothetical protein
MRWNITFKDGTTGYVEAESIEAGEGRVGFFREGVLVAVASDFYLVEQDVDADAETSALDTFWEPVAVS